MLFSLFLSLFTSVNSAYLDRNRMVSRVGASTSSIGCNWTEKLDLKKVDTATIDKILDNTWIECFPSTDFTRAIQIHIKALIASMSDKRIDTGDINLSARAVFKQGMEVIGSENLLYYKQYKDNESVTWRRYQAVDVVTQIIASVLSILYTNHHSPGLHYMLPVVYETEGLLGLLERKIDFKYYTESPLIFNTIRAFDEWTLETYGIKCVDHQGFDEQMSTVRMTDVVCQDVKSSGPTFEGLLPRLLSECAHCQLPEGITILQAS